MFHQRHTLFSNPTMLLDQKIKRLKYSMQYFSSMPYFFTPRILFHIFKKHAAQYSDLRKTEFTNTIYVL